MDLDEAIKHAEEVARENRNKGCDGCAEQHDQLAKWLKELRVYSERRSTEEVNMKKEDLIRKLTSRKLWMAVALFVSGVLTATGKSDNAETVAGLIMQGAAVLGYILGEGLADASNITINDGKEEQEE